MEFLKKNVKQEKLNADLDTEIHADLHAV